MGDWNPIHLSNKTAGDIVALLLIIFGFIIFLIILKKVVQLSKGKK